ncbi:MAG: hypothetical protein QXL27_09475 [Candidatus Bathyarchaeia archaeon]
MSTIALEQKHLHTRYQVILRKNTAIFLWGSTPQKPLKSSIDLKTKINPKELLLLAEEFNSTTEDGRILVQSLDIYNRLLIYACVRASLRKSENIRKLRGLISGMTSYDAHYWASAFRELWWKYGRRVSLQKTIKAFKLFFRIE